MHYLAGFCQGSRQFQQTHILLLDRNFEQQNKVPLLFFIMHRVQSFAMPFFRQIKRTIAVLRSPVYQHFQETLDGLSSIRASDCKDYFQKLSESKIQKFIAALYIQEASKKWFNVRLLGVMVVLKTLVMLVFVLLRGKIQAGVAGLAIMYLFFEMFL